MAVFVVFDNVLSFFTCLVIIFVLLTSADNLSVNDDLCVIVTTEFFE